MSVLGVDLGGTSLAWIADANGEYSRGQMPTPRGAENIVAAIADVAVDVGATAIGVATMGIVDPVDGSIISASDSMPGWARFPAKQRLREVTGLPVEVINDVNAFLLGELSQGAVAGESSAFGIMLGAGVGGAIQLGGALFGGEYGGAGEIGHMPGFGDEECTCGGRGHLETLASGRSIARRYGERVGRQVPDAGVVAARAEEGDIVAAAVVDEAGYAVGLALTMVATLLDLDLAVVGGGVVKSWDWLEPGLRRALADYPLISGRDLRVEVSSLGDDAPRFGALAAVR